jgi:L-lactate dehydrogenase complex protein LldF
VKINIHEQIYAWRRELVKQHEVPSSKSRDESAGELLSRPAAYRAAIAACLMPHSPICPASSSITASTPGGSIARFRMPPKQTFHSWYQSNRGEKP